MGGVWYTRGVFLAIGGHLIGPSLTFGPCLLVSSRVCKSELGALLLSGRMCALSGTFVGFGLDAPLVSSPSVGLFIIIIIIIIIVSGCAGFWGFHLCLGRYR